MQFKTKQDELLQTMLSSVQALQASVKAIEAKLDNPASMVVPTSTEAPESGLQAVEEPIKKHPLEDYKITEKDIGSLVLVWDDVDQDDASVTSLGDVREEGHYPVKSHNGCGWQYAKPYLDTVALHFKPWYATEEDIPPPDVKNGEFVAILLEDGEIRIDDTPREWNWANNVIGFRIVGYRPLSFVNPIVDEEK